jgi:hypothetical protein
MIIRLPSEIPLISQNYWLVLVNITTSRHYFYLQKNLPHNISGLNDAAYLSLSKEKHIFCLIKHYPMICQQMLLV